MILKTGIQQAIGTGKLRQEISAAMDLHEYSLISREEREVQRADAEMVSRSTKRTYVGSSPLQGQLVSVLQLRGYRYTKLRIISYVALSLVHSCFHYHCSYYHQRTYSVRSVSLLILLRLPLWHSSCSTFRNDSRVLKKKETYFNDMEISGHTHWIKLNVL